MDGSEDVIAMFWKIGLFLVLSLQVSGCANTQSGKGFDLVRDKKYSEALPHFEAAAEQDGSKSSAVMASFIYLSDYQIHRDIDKAIRYFELAESLDYGRWDQHLDYFIPLAEAQIMLYDEDPDNDKQGTTILRGDRYSEFSPALGLLAKAYAFGKGVDKNLTISKLLFERSVDKDSHAHSAHRYAWFLVVHPDEAFRDGELAEKLIEDVMDDDDEERASKFDTLAAIHAENGRFEEAIKAQKRAIDSLVKDYSDYPEFSDRKSRFECRLKSYERKEPLHIAPQGDAFSSASGRHSCELE